MTDGRTPARLLQTVARFNLGYADRIFKRLLQSFKLHKNCRYKTPEMSSCAMFLHKLLTVLLPLCNVRWIFKLRVYACQTDPQGSA
jgi:hypothetical protein